jgi:hypothetical protein
MVQRQMKARALKEGRNPKAEGRRKFEVRKMFEIPFLEILFALWKL